MSVFKDNSESIGRTPLIKINRLTQGLGATVYAKIEGRNPGYSVKCRIGSAMIWDAEKTGKLKPGIHVVEPTSGNTGIALAFVCAARGYPLTLTMPETMSIERRAMLRGFGAELVLTAGADGMKGAIAKAEELSQQPGWYMPQQQGRRFSKTRMERLTTSLPVSGQVERLPVFRSTSSSRRSLRSNRLPSSLSPVRFFPADHLDVIKSRVLEPVLCRGSSTSACLMKFCRFPMTKPSIQPSD